MGQLLRGGDVRWRTPDRAEFASLTPEAFRATWEPLLKSGPIEVQIYADIGDAQVTALVRKTFGVLSQRTDAPADAANQKRAFPAHNDAQLQLRIKRHKEPTTDDIARQ